MFTPISRFITGRFTGLITVVFWLVLVFGLGSVASKFEDVQKNEFSSYLPEQAEAVKALKITNELPGSDSIQAITVFQRDDGLTPADLKAISTTTERLKSADIPKTSTPLPEVISKDKTTALLTSQIITTGDDSESITEAVKEIRKITADKPSGMNVFVTGPAGYSYDAIQIFEGTGNTLLLGAGTLILLLLIAIYRSPIFWIIPAIAVVFSEIVARGCGYLLAELGLTITTQSAQIMSVLVLGAGTDYALLLVSRYREELHHHKQRRAAMRKAIQQAGPTIFGSGLTVIAALLCLSFAEINSTAGLGPTGAIGVAVAMLTMLTLLPAMLVSLPRTIFWPFTPRYDMQAETSATKGFWRSLGDKIAAKPRITWIAITLLLVAGLAGLGSYNTDLTQDEQFVTTTDSVKGQRLISAAFPGGTNAPTDVIVKDQSKIGAVSSELKQDPNVANVAVGPTDGKVTNLVVTLKQDPYSQEAIKLVPELRERVRSVAGDQVLVGGTTAIEYDLRESARADNRMLAPLVLVVVLIILILLLRSLVAPLLLIGTVIISFAASFGISALVFNHIFGYSGSDPQLFIFAFIFLVALGVDYNIFLMTRVREEALQHGTREGMLRGLAATGSVITSAGIVLAGTFFVLMILPLVQLVQIGFVIGFGVLLDTFIVRSILAPALTFDIGEKIWWPKLIKRSSD